MILNRSDRTSHGFDWATSHLARSSVCPKPHYDHLHHHSGLAWIEEIAANDAKCFCNHATPSWRIQEPVLCPWERVGAHTLRFLQGQNQSWTWWAFVSPHSGERTCSPSKGPSVHLLVQSSCCFFGLLASLGQTWSGSLLRCFCFLIFDCVGAQNYLHSVVLSHASCRGMLYGGPFRGLSYLVVSQMISPLTSRYLSLCLFLLLDFLFPDP